jgi:hypothetical protein
MLPRELQNSLIEPRSDGVVVMADVDQPCGGQGKAAIPVADQSDATVRGTTVSSPGSRGSSTRVTTGHPAGAYLALGWQLERRAVDRSLERATSQP